MLREIRRQQSTLICAGKGVIAFGIWDVVNFILYVLFARERIDQLLPADMEYEYRKITMIVAIITVFVILMINLFIRVKFGRTAINIGHGNSIKHTKIYMFMSVYFTISQIISIGMNLLSAEYSFGMADRIMSLIVSFTSLSIFLQLLIAGWKLKQYQREYERLEVARCS